MKKCPFCAEQIQDAALVCKHCGRDFRSPVQYSTQTAAPAPPVPAAKNKRVGCLPALLVGIGILFAFALLQSFLLDEPTAPADPILAVSAGRGPTGIAITNRERQTLTECDATVLDEESSRWTAAIEEAVPPSGTVFIPWPDFRQNGQPMPGYIGRGRDNAIIACKVGDQGRRSAGIHF